MIQFYSAIHKVLSLLLIGYLIISAPIALFSVPWLLAGSVVGFLTFTTPIVILGSLAELAQVISFIIYPIFIWKFWKKRPNTASWLIIYVFCALFFPTVLLFNNLLSGSGTNIVIGSQFNINQLDFIRLSTQVIIWFILFLYLKISNWRVD